MARDLMLKAVEQMAFLNRKILAVTRFAARAFIADYVEQIARSTGSARVRLDVKNQHPGLTMR